MRGTRAVIHLDNLQNNILEIKKFLAPKTKLCVAVKANAYGHGAVECARTALACGADFLAVAAVDEGLELRKARIKAPVLLLSLCSPDEVDAAVRNNLTPLVFDEEYISLFAEAAGAAGKKSYPVHLAVDTGMGRIGCEPHEAGKIARAVADTGALCVGGICTHFAVSDEVSTKSRDFTGTQFRLFEQAIKSVEAQGIDPGIRHCCNSAATIDHPEFHMDMVRPGIIVYGYYAEEISKEYLEKKGTPLNLKPVMTLQTVVSAVRHFEEGKSAGYGRTWTAGVPTDIAVLPIGYGDGWARRFALNGIPVSINGKEYPVRGRICMDQCMVDVGSDAANGIVRRWDKVILFGAKEDGALQTADDVAKLTGTISYEITSCITSRVPREFTGGRQDTGPRNKDKRA